MKITKKKPLRPRGRSDEKRQSTKDAIREVYANGPQKEVQIIPAKKDMIADMELLYFAGQDVSVWKKKFFVFSLDMNLSGLLY